MGMLKELDIFVRSHLSPLKDEQVALMRARWEREKRKSKEPALAPKRRRGAKVAAEAPVAVEPEGRPTRRRRTAADVAAADAEAQATAAALEAERELKATQALEASLAEEAARPQPSLEERAAALFKDIPAPSDSRAAASEAGTATAEAPSGPPSAPSLAPPVTPGAPPRPLPVRPRPVASGVPSSSVPPPPVASAAPGSLDLEAHPAPGFRQVGADRAGVQLPARAGGGVGSGARGH